MKKITTIVLMLLISFCFILTGCGGANLSMPKNYQTPVSNGGFVVGAGNYMYFANAFKAYTSLTESSDNNGDKVAQHSLKRLELDTSHSWFDIVKDEENKYNYENVTNKISAYETSSMYVVNDYLYFTSPNIHKNDKNEHEFGLSSLFRIKLDGSDLKEILTTDSSTAQFYLTQDKKLLLFDNSKIKMVNLKNNQTTATTLAEGVKNVVFPKQEEQDIAWLYYTSDRNEEDLISGNVLNKVSIKTGEVVKDVYKVPNVTITIVAQENGRLFYTKTGGAEQGLFSDDFSSAYSKIHHRTLIEGITDSSDLMYIECDNSDYSSFVFLYGDNLYVQLISATNDSQAQKITSETTTILFYNGSYVYYSTSNGIYRYSIIDKDHQQITNDKDIQASAVDFDGRYVYYFVKGEKQETDTKYLYRADCYSEEIREECIAELLEKDIPEDDELVPEE